MIRAAETVEKSSRLQTGEIDPEKFFWDNIVQRQVPTISELCQEEGVNIDDLSARLQSKVDAIVAYVHEESSIIDNSLDSQIDFVYRCWAASRQPPISTNLTQTLSSFENFIQAFCSDISKKDKSNLIRRIDRFIASVVHPSRLLTIYGPQHRMRTWSPGNIYDYTGKWVMINDFSKYNYAEYADPSVLQEALDITPRVSDSPFLYHCTGSAALAGIGRQEAILSAQKAIEVGEEIKTGEYTTYLDYEGVSVSGGKSGLGSVYVRPHDSTGYCIARWFDEYHVAFAVSSEKIRQFFSQQGWELPYFFDSSEGIRISHKVPLSAVEIVYTNKIYVPRLTFWVQKHCPWVQVSSFEAKQLRNQLGINKIKTLLSQSQPVKIN